MVRVGPRGLGACGTTVLLLSYAPVLLFFILCVQSEHNNLSYLTSSTDLLYFSGSLFASNLWLTLSVPVKGCGFVNIQHIKDA